MNLSKQIQEKPEDSIDWLQEKTKVNFITTRIWLVTHFINTSFVWKQSNRILWSTKTNSINWNQNVTKKGKWKPRKTKSRRSSCIPTCPTKTRKLWLLAISQMPKINLRTSRSIGMDFVFFFFQFDFQIDLIKFDSFDIAFGKELLLSNAELTLAFGRRYGLVGRNGTGSKIFLLSVTIISLSTFRSSELTSQKKK